jgi:hypothetical protein
VSRALVIAAAGVVIVGGGIGLFVVLSPAPATRTAPPAATAPRPVTPPRETTPAPAIAPDESRSKPARRPPAKPDAPASPVVTPPAAPAPDTGILTIDADVAGAQVFLDRVFIGAAPVVARDVKPGSHRLNVSAEGYDGYADTIEVSPGPRDIRVKFKEVRLNLSIEVVHKHRIGSCKGRLTATPQGLRYEASNAEDAFTTPLLDLETFQMDYLAKNLKVQAKKGRRFDFTDPEGNADRLFVFHRDVDKARERLKKGDL